MWPPETLVSLGERWVPLKDHPDFQPRVGTGESATRASGLAEATAISATAPPASRVTHEDEPPMRWFIFTQVRLVLGAVVALGNSLKSGADEGSPIPSVAIAVACFFVVVGLGNRRRWAWNAYIVLLALECLLYSVAAGVGAASGPGGRLSPTDFLTASLVILAVMGLAWFWPNYLYFRKRRYLFNGNLGAAGTYRPQEKPHESGAGRVLAVLAGIVYFGLGLVQLAAIMEGLKSTLKGPALLLAFLLSAIVSYIPIVGTILGIRGAISGWGWSPLGAILFFCWPYALYLVALSLGGLATLLVATQRRFRERSYSAPLGPGVGGSEDPQPLLSATGAVSPASEPPSVKFSTREIVAIAIVAALLLTVLIVATQHERQEKTEAHNSQRQFQSPQTTSQEQHVSLSPTPSPPPGPEVRQPESPPVPPRREPAPSYHSRPPRPAQLLVKSDTGGAVVRVRDESGNAIGFGTQQEVPLPTVLKFLAGTYFLQATRADCLSPWTRVELNPGTEGQITMSLSCPTPAPIEVPTKAPEPPSALGANETGQRLTADLQVYLNSSSSSGLIELLLDGKRVAAREFRFKDAGIFRDTVSIPSGVHTLAYKVRAKGRGLVVDQEASLVVPPRGRCLLRVVLPVAPDAAETSVQCRK